MRVDALVAQEPQRLDRRVLSLPGSHLRDHAEYQRPRTRHAEASTRASAVDARGVPAIEVDRTRDHLIGTFGASACARRAVYAEFATTTVALAAIMRIVVRESTARRQAVAHVHHRRRASRARPTTIPARTVFA